MAGAGVPGGLQGGVSRRPEREGEERGIHRVTHEAHPRGQDVAVLRIVFPRSVKGWAVALLLLGALAGINAYAVVLFADERRLTGQHTRVAGVVRALDTYKGHSDLLVHTAAGELRVLEDGSHRAGESVVLEVSTQDVSKARLLGTRALSYRGRVIFIVEGVVVAVLGLFGIVVKVASKDPSSH